MATPDFGGGDLRVALPRSVRVNAAQSAPERMVRATIVSETLRQELGELTGAPPEAFPLSTRVADFTLEAGDEVVVRGAESDLPLVVRRGGEVIVNFDVGATRAFKFTDSKRPIYTYLPGFNVHKVPAGIRRRVSNLLQSRHWSTDEDVVGRYRRLPLTTFEFVVLLLNKIDAQGAPLVDWPEGKRAAFISLHDVDTGGFLRR